MTSKLDGKLIVLSNGQNLTSFVTKAKTEAGYKRASKKYWKLNVDGGKMYAVRMKVYDKIHLNKNGDMEGDEILEEMIYE
jgi:hypothetical protein